DVLIAGGNGGVGGVELYHPGTGTFAGGLCSTLATREYHTATRLPSGKVLIAGGYYVGYLSSAVLYDPSTGLCTNTTGAMTALRARHTATLLGAGRVLI